jgi:hypothetical protein
MSPDPATQAPVPAGQVPTQPDATQAQPDATHMPAPVDWSEESTVGEEDPGASLDLGLDPPAPQASGAAPDPPAPQRKP